MKRRSFLKQSAGLAAAGLFRGPLIKASSSKIEYDLVIKEGLIYDGQDGLPFVSDISIASGVIRSVGKMKGGPAGAVLEAKGLAVSPGFIDVHDHSDVSLLANPNAESIVHQGITTVISGQCGGTPFPVPDLVVEERKEDYKKLYGVDLTWRDMAGFFARLEEKTPAVNYATLVGHGSIRGAVVGFNDRPPTADELAEMKRLVEEHIRGGAFGLSTGLEYQPGSFARPEEIAELCRVVARHQAVYATHMRNEGDGILESLDESIGAAQASGAKLQISHFKVAYRRNWPKLDAALGRLERAKQDGVDVFCDRYPYIAASTGLSYYFPPWTKEGTTEDFIRRLKDPSADARLRAYLKEQERRLGSWDKVVISSVASEKNRRIQGKNILEAAREAGQEPYVFIRDLLIEEDGMVDMIIFIMNEDNLKKILGHPLVGVGCDGSAAAPYGILSLGQPHPRNYGTFPRYLGKYVRVEKVLTLEEAIRKITSVPAVRFGLAKRGMIKEGYSADLVVFNPDRIEDKATWKAPHQYPAGIEYVIVNGQVVVDHNQHTGRRAGHILKKQA